MLLQKLSGLKHRLLTERAHELDATEVLMELVSFLHTGVALSDVERRIAALATERLLRALWSQSNYKCGNLNTRGEDDALRQLADFYQCGTDGERTELGPIFQWLGGVYPFTSTATPITQSRLQHASILLLLYILLHELQPSQKKSPLEERLLATLHWTTKVSLLELADALIESDERCLHFILALHTIHQCADRGGGGYKNDSTELPDSLTLFLALIERVGFDAGVVVDWLCSDEVAIPLIYRATKALKQAGKDGFSTRVAVIRSSSTSSCHIKYELIGSLAHPSSTTSGQATSGSGWWEDGNGLQLEVEELHGEMNVQRRLTVPTKGHTQLVVKKGEDSKEPMSELEYRRRYIAFFNDLLAILQRLQKRQLLQFNASALIKALVELLEVISG